MIGAPHGKQKKENSMIKYYDKIEQGTDDWHKLRLGIVTASNINILLTPTGKPAKGAKVMNYAYEIVAQRVTGRTGENFQSFDMLRGHIQENIARDCYAEAYSDVVECGFILRDDKRVTIGASPDGLIDANGGIEIKSRLAKFQIDTIANNKMDQKYYNQIQATLWASDREWWDFVQYSNGLPLFVKRIFPDVERQEAIVNAVFDFELIIADIQAIYTENEIDKVKTEYVDIMMDEEITESEA